MIILFASIRRLDIGPKFTRDTSNFGITRVVEWLEDVEDALLRPITHHIEIDKPANFRRTSL